MKGKQKEQLGSKVEKDWGTGSEENEPQRFGIESLWADLKGSDVTYDYVKMEYQAGYGGTDL